MKELIKKIERHGMCGTPEYKSWQKMKERCNNPKANRFNRYGGRGIKPCQSWDNSFTAFFKDMGKKPFPKAQLDRKDNDLGYYKGNCRWISPAGNSQNRSTTKATAANVKRIRKLYSQGVVQARMAEKFGLSKYVVNRIVLNLTWKNV